MPNPSVTYIVSSYDRPRALRGCLAALQVQTDPDFEVIVADRAADERIAAEHWLIVGEMRDERFRYVHASSLVDPWNRHCYYFITWLVEQGHTNGEWLCFPSDDSYYVPTFQATCLARARLNNWSLVWPEMLYDPRLHGRYALLDARACVGGIDKTGFLLRRDAWIGFPTLGRPESGDACADGEMIVTLVARGVAHGKVDEIMVVHN